MAEVMTNMGTLEPVLTNLIVSSYDGDIDDGYVC